MKKPTRKQILEALCRMWQQYCPPPFTHMCMGAGENAEEILQDYGLLDKDGNINWDKLK